MSDPVFSSWVNCEGGVCCTEATAIMDALIAERDELRERVKYMSDGGEAYRTEARKWAERERSRAEAAEARVKSIEAYLMEPPEKAQADNARLREALREAREFVDRRFDGTDRSRHLLERIEALLADPRNRDDNPHPDKEGG